MAIRDPCGDKNPPMRPLVHRTPHHDVPDSHSCDSNLRPATLLGWLRGGHIWDVCTSLIFAS